MGALNVFDLDMIERCYSSFPKKLKKIRDFLKRPLTLTEKILYMHLAELPEVELKRGKDYANFFPDRVAMQDATAQMALLQFASSGKKASQVPATVHCDHLILAEKGAKKDLERALHDSKEVFDFLQSASLKFGIGFWKPGSGIIHQVLLEHYAFPGGLMIGTDSHTPNAGGLGMLAIGVGGADAVDVMAGMEWELKIPRIIGVHLKGKLQGWSSAKDVILTVAGRLTVKGGTDSVIEYFGEGAKSLSCTGKATICNMGAEIGATTSVFSYDEKMRVYLEVTKREKVAELAEGIKECLTADPEIEKDPGRFFDEVIEIDLSSLEPHVNGPYTPDLAWPLSKLAEGVRNKGYPEKISVALIGSCTNSSYEDIERAASIARQAAKHGLLTKSPLTITPGSEQIRATIERDGQLEALEAIGGVVLANACGPCIGQWMRHDVNFGEKNSILTSYNRNFSGRNDANPGTHSFVASPEIVIALALAGKLTFNPITDPLIDKDGNEVYLEPPTGKELPKSGFCSDFYGYIEPKKEDAEKNIVISPNSERLELLKPFPPRKKEDFLNLRILAKVVGKCTTDHISPAGKWLRYRGHLDKISDNLLSGAVNAFEDEIGKGRNLLNMEIEPFSEIARSYKKKNIGWVIVGEENYGEGSSREHAAMEPRFLGGVAVLVKSFARIHETNLKKQGMLAATFQNKGDYDKLLESDILDFTDIENIAPGKPLKLTVVHVNGKKDEIFLNHTYNEHQIAWLFAGSALNLIGSKN